MVDLTIIYYTANILPEPALSNIQKSLVEAAPGIPIISVSQKPISFGKNICVGPIGQSSINIYKQVLIGAREAKTKYVAMAEDDTLYSKEHFTQYVPKDDEFSYDYSRWCIYTWIPDIYAFRTRIVNSLMICPRDLLITSLEERYAKYPDESKIPLGMWGECGRFERQLGITPRKFTPYFATVPNVVLTHEQSLGFKYQGRRKKLGYIRAYDIPYWGKANELVAKIYGKNNKKP